MFGKKTAKKLDDIAAAKRDLANAKTPEDRENLQIALELAEAGVVMPWIKQSRRTRG